MRILSLFIICLFFVACDTQKSKKNSTGAESVVSSPSVSIETESLVGIMTSNTINFIVNGGCSEEGLPVLVSVGNVSPETAPVCSSGTWEVAIDVSGLGASGEITITADHSTSGGLAATQAVKTVTLYPRVGIAANLGNITGATFAVNGTCSEDGQAVTVSVGGDSTTLTATICTSEGTWSANVDVSGLGASGEITITANHATSGTSPLAATQAVQTVTLYPRVGIAANLGNITGATFAVNGTCSEDGQAVTVSVGGDSTTLTATTCTSEGTWSASVDVSELTGASRPITITADHAATSGSVPLAANQASETVTFYPRVKIAANLGNITEANASSFTVTGTCSEDGQAVMVNVGTVTASPAPSCTSTGTWSVDIDVSRLLTGASREITITANHSTSGSNPLAATQANEAVTLAPRVGIADTLANITEANAGSFTVNGTCSEDSQAVTVSVGTVAASPAPNCTSTGTWSVDIDVSRLLTGASREITITANHSTSGASPLAAAPASETVTLAPRVGIADTLANITTANAGSFTVTGTCSEDGQAVTVSVGTVAASPAPSCTSTGTWSVDIDVSSLLTGASREITITANHSTSGSNPLAAAPASETVTLAPRVSIADTVGNITGSTFAVNGTCSENGQPVTVSVGTVTASPVPNCSATGTWSVDIDVSSLLTGASREITITANHSTSGASPLAAAPASETVTLAPRVGIADTLANITTANAGSFTVTGTCSEDGQAVTVSVGTVAASPAPSCTSTGTWSVDIDVSSLLTGASREITITANHSTSGSNPLAAAPASETVTLAPRVSIADTVGNITGSTFAVNGTCSENGQPVTVSVGGESPTTAPTCTTGTWSTSVDVSGLGASGSVDITVDHSTSDGLAATQASKTVTLYPRVSIDVTVGNITVSPFSVTGTCSENGQPVTVSVGGMSPMTAPTCTNGAWVTEVNVSSLNSGPSKVIAITADHASLGGQSATQATGTALLPPRVSVDTGLTNVTSTNASTFDVTGTCSEEGEEVTVSVDTVNATTTCATGGTWTARVNLSGLSGGPLSITADHLTSSGLEAIQATGSVIAYLTFSIDELEDITAANAGSFTVSGRCLEEGEPVAVVVGGGTGSVSPGTNPDCTSGAWTIIMDVTGVNKAGEEISVTANHSPATGSAHPEQTLTVTNEFICPTNYVGVPALASYTTNSFCVMKYEAKSDGSDMDDDDDMDTNNAVAQATGTPYVNINRADSITKCMGLNGEGENKYDLITNDEWQSIARNIELVSDNWSTGVVGNAGGLSRGHSDGAPNNPLAAISDDTKGCEGTGQICSNTVWDNQRRTYTLSNGEVIWDIAGNVWEWAKDHNGSTYGSDAYFSQVTEASHSTSNSLSGGTTTIARNAKAQFGPSGNYVSLNTYPHGGLGHGFLDSSAGGIFRSGSWSNSFNAGLFAAHLYNTPLVTSVRLGFRCVLHP